MTTPDANHVEGVQPSPPGASGEDYPETVAGTSGGAGAAETEIVPPITQAAPGHAWSQEELETEAITQPWSQAWSRAAVFLLCGVLLAAVTGVAVWASTLPDRTPPTAPSTPTAAPSTASAAPTPTAQRIDDDEFVAIALSPRALNNSNSQSGAGFGTSGTQERANQIALSECRAGLDTDDCLLVTAGMFHGCVSYAITLDSGMKEWAGATGPTPDSAKAAALARLARPGVAAVQCSDPPGIIKTPPAAASLPPAPAPTKVTVQAQPRHHRPTLRSSTSARTDMKVSSGDTPAARSPRTCVRSSMPQACPTVSPPSRR